MSVPRERDERYMRLAIAAARRGIRNGQTPFGACIVKKGKVVACAHNTVWRLSDSTAHAEVTAIRRACRVLGTIDLSGCTMYTTCEPCPMCFSACHWARISRIVYGAGISDAAKAGFRELSISPQRMKRLGGASVRLASGILRDENRGLFAEWKRTRRARTY